MAAQSTESPAHAVRHMAVISLLNCSLIGPLQRLITLTNGSFPTVRPPRCLTGWAQLLSWHRVSFTVAPLTPTPWCRQIVKIHIGLVMCIWTDQTLFDLFNITVFFSQNMCIKFPNPMKRRPMIFTWLVAIKRAIWHQNNSWTSLCNISKEITFLFYWYKFTVVIVFEPLFLENSWKSAVKPEKCSSPWKL